MSDTSAPLPQDPFLAKPPPHTPDRRTRKEPEIFTVHQFNGLHFVDARWQGTTPVHMSYQPATGIGTISIDSDRNPDTGLMGYDTRYTVDRKGGVTITELARGTERVIPPGSDAGREAQFQLSRLDDYTNLYQIGVNQIASVVQLLRDAGVEMAPPQVPSAPGNLPATPSTQVQER